jgi:hypothetical protein
MNAPISGLGRPLALRVKEPSTGLFYWVVTELAGREHEPDVSIDSSDHPYPTHESALMAGNACLNAIKSSVGWR